MRIHCIHSKEDRPDRDKLITDQIEKYGLDVIFFPSIKSFPRPKMSINAAHKAVIRYAKDNGMEKVCVAENDFQLLGNGAWEYFLANEPTDYDIYLSNVIWGQIGNNNTTQDFAGLNLYLMHNRYYNTFLESDSNRDIDRAQARRGVFRVCVPFAAVQAETFSDNTKRIYYHTRLYKNRQLYAG